MAYARGEGVIRSMPDAVVWFRKAAERGHAEAQYHLGLVYLHGGPADAGFVNWFSQASDKQMAERNKDLLFPNGLDVQADHAEALRWCRAAAEKGLAAAQANLALMYARGLGVELDYVEARRWYELAADQGNANAELGLGVIYANGFGTETDLARGAF